MSSRGLFLLVALAGALSVPLACGPDPEPAEPCTGGPDFDVLISAGEEEDLPSDTRVVLIYGSGTEEYQLSGHNMPQVLFCARSDREGEPLAGGGGAASGGGAAGNGGAGGASGAGGTGASAGGAAPLAPSGVPALRCTLWTQGPATLEITGTGYLDQVEELELMRGTCTVEAQLELMRGDGGA